MLPVLESAAPSWDSFDVQTASTLFYNGISFLVRQQDREDAVCELTVRIILGVHRNNHNSRVCFSKEKFLLVCMIQFA